MRSILIGFCIAFICIPIVAWLRFDFVNNGHGWRQGDWLVNFGAGPVRRGLIGEALIAASDLSGVSLLMTTLAVQGALFATIAFVFWRIATHYTSDAVLLLLVASPAFFLIFFSANPTAAMRKELFGVLAVGLLVLASARRRPTTALPILAVAAFTVGCIGNIQHVLLLPAVLVGLFVMQAQGEISRHILWVLSTLATGMAVLWFVFAIAFNSIGSLDEVCGPLTARGFDADICDHAIRWLVADEVDHRAEVLIRLTSANLLEFALLLPFALAPLALCLIVFAERRVIKWIVVLCFLPLLPLYALATDWGRWLSLSYTLAALLVVQSHLTNRLTLVWNPPGYLVLGLMAVSLLVAHEHSIGWRPMGAIFSIIETIGVFI